jgi:F-type H+-transporting ATPase subunit gamma
MPTIADLRLELDDATTLKLISSAFTEAAASRVQKIKKQFETNRQFYDEISHVYHLVRLSAKDRPAFAKASAGNAGKGKKLSVAVTSNQRFYGNLNVNIMHGFLDAVERTDTDVLLIGTTGQDFMRSTTFTKPYEHMIFVHDDPTREETSAFLDKIMKYETVMMYYPKFMSLVTQTVGIVDITQAVTPGDKTPEDEIHILFEPEYSKILTFFQRQVRSLLFLHVMLEADLSRTAARLITMSSADERSTELIKQKKGELRKIQASIANVKLLETFSGMTKWKK